MPKLTSRLKPTSRRARSAGPSTTRSLRGARRREAFVIEYLKDLNATQAAIRAGYAPKTANREGARLLSFADIQQRVAAALTERKVEAHVESERLEREAEKIAISDIRRLFRNGRLLAPEDIPDDIAPAIASFEVVTREYGKGEVLYLNRFKFWDKNSAQRTIFQLRGDGKVNDKNVSVSGELTVRAFKEQTVLGARHLTNDEYEQAVKLSKEIAALNGPLKLLIDLGLSRARARG